MASLSLANPSWYSTWAAANAACPQRSISTSGENHRIDQARLEMEIKMRFQADRTGLPFFCNSSVDNHSCKIQTPAGLPEYEFLEKALAQK